VSEDASRVESASRKQIAQYGSMVYYRNYFAEIGFASQAAALQAAWAWTRRTEGWGVPQESDPLEGWIVDLGLVSAADVAAVCH